MAKPRDKTVLSCGHIIKYPVDVPEPVAKLLEEFRTLDDRARQGIYKESTVAAVKAGLKLIEAFRVSEDYNHINYNFHDFYKLYLNGQISISRAYRLRKLAIVHPELKDSPISVLYRLTPSCLLRFVSAPKIIRDEVAKLLDKGEVIQNETINDMSREIRKKYEHYGKGPIKRSRA